MNIKTIGLVIMLGAGVVSAADFSSWQKKMPITFTGYNPSGGATALTNFPALVVLSTNISGFSYSDFLSLTNQDLRFTAADETNELNYEIESWDTNGSSFVWVQVSELADTNTSVWAHWGQPGTNAPAYTTNGATWSNGYAAVWHMAQTNALDSSPSHRNGAVAGGSVAATNGVVNGADSFSSGYVVATSPVQTSGNTVSLWFRANSVASGQKGIFTTGSSPVEGSPHMLLVHNNTALQTYRGSYVTLATIAAQTWYHLTLVHDATTEWVYLNGVYATSRSWSTAGNNANLYIGSGYSANFQGQIDEFQVSTTLRSSNWVWACYMNQASNGTFAGSFNSYGTVQAVDPDLPQIANLGSPSRTDTSADMVGRLLTNGVSTATVYLYWSTNDGTTNASDWTTGGSVTNLGSVANETTFTNTLSGLASNTTYYWNYSASNSSGTVWGATYGSPSFKTFGPPEITNGLGATGVDAVSAVLNGSLNGIGAHVYILRGQQDGVWSVTNDLGMLGEGAFSNVVFGLDSGTRYYYTCYATNSYGTAWAVPSVAFTTLTTVVTFSSWQKKMPITFTGYNPPGGATTLTNFPALVVLSTNISGFSYGDFQSRTNQDLRFTTADQTTELSYEIEKWDTNGSSYVWVQLGNLAHSNTMIWAYWGKIGTNAEAYTTNGATWSDGYVGVWHMGQTNALDSTVSTNHGQAVKNTTATGFIANGQSFNGTDAGITVPVAASSGLRISGSNLTQSAWVKSLDNVRREICARGGHYYFERDSNEKLDAYMYGVSTAYDYSTGTVPTNVWALAAMVYDGTRLRFYINGIEAGSVARSGNVTVLSGSVDASFTLGMLPTTSRYWKGLLDEVRVSSVARSSNWMWACYMNQASNGTFEGSFNTYGAAINVLPQIVNIGSQSATDSSVDIVGTLAANGMSAASIYLYWSITDGTNNATAWTAGGNVTNLGSVADGTTFTNTLSGLVSNTTYYWNHSASNTFGTVWGSTMGSPTFKTLGPPSVDNANGASSINMNQAVLNGNLSDGASAHLYFYWWTNGAPSTNVCDLGTGVEGAFSTNLTGLTGATTYYYQSYATNDYGAALAPATNFTTTSATAWYVATNGNGADGLSWVTAFTNIQTAIDAVQSNETIYLAAHTFNIGTNAAMTSQITVAKSFLTLQGGYAGTGNPGDRTEQPTLINLQSGTNRIFWLGGVTNVTLDGLTLANGFANLGEYGGGLFVTNSTNVVVSSCVFATNHVKGAFGGSSVAIGGGLFVVNSGVLVSNCQFIGNYAYRGDGSTDRRAYGGGAACSNSTVMFRDCVARFNWAQDVNWGGRAFGGAFYVNGGACTLRNCLIYGNYLVAERITEESGHGVYVAGGTVAIENCDILNNRREGCNCEGGTLTVRDSIIRGHLANDLISPTWTSNSIVGLSTNPAFERGIYLATNSPAVDAGSRTVAAAGLSGTTTRADGTPDSDPVDIGYHVMAGIEPATADFYVSPAVGKDDGSYPGTNWSQPFKTISNALTLARIGTHIYLDSGLYGTNSGELFPIVLDKPGQQLLGTNAAATVIDAASAGRTAVTLQNVVGDGRLEGVTIRNADGNTYYGGGIYAVDSDLTVASCTLSNNNVRHKTLQGTGYGGGLYALYCVNILVSNVTFRGNTASGSGNGGGFGGGAYFGASRATMLNSTFVSNTAAAQGASQLPYGGGMALNGSFTSIRNTLLAGNRCTRNDDGGTAGRFGHGAYVTGGSAGFENCTFVTNVGTAVGATSYGEGLRVASATVGATNCIFWSHVMDTTGTVSLAYCDIESGISNGVNGNISANPLFKSTVSGDYRLQGGSPCINTGTDQAWMYASVDLDGQPRIAAGRVDMGAYEAGSMGSVFVVH